MRVSATVCLRSSNSSSKVTLFVQYMVPSARVESFTCGTKLHCSRSKIWFRRDFASANFRSGDISAKPFASVVAKEREAAR